MDSIALLRKQFEQAHWVMEGTMEGVTNEHAAVIPQGKANSIGASYAHVILSEDWLINMFHGQTPMFATTWAGKTGVSEMMPASGSDWATRYNAWTRSVKVDLPAAREYARAVYAMTDEYLATLKPEDLDHNLDLSAAGMGQMDLGSALSLLALSHVSNLAGEISAIKGTQGLTGYPF